ncbi:hypothetical protein GOODEAATRI_020165 [Goodea atripinnis]|uniref:Uncharacterized protein n=1 Tax=Goodea atripinnis TaxID=208336 RepID=A0ABV0N3T4_9TELE
MKLKLHNPRCCFQHMGQASLLMFQNPQKLLLTFLSGPITSRIFRYGQDVAEVLTEMYGQNFQFVRLADSQLSDGATILFVSEPGPITLDFKARLLMVMLSQLYFTNYI